MKTFSSLLEYREGKTPRDAQAKARSGFPKKVSQSKLRLRNPGDPLPATGRHFIVGVASYSADELGLLDQLQDFLEKAKIHGIDVEVFDVLSCGQMGDFEKFIPGIGGVYRTPIVGVVSDGKLIDHASGLSDVGKTLRRFKLLDHS
jgi:hypothetical protein